MKVKSQSEVAQSCPTLGDPMDCSLPGSDIHGIFQARVLEWGAIAFSVLLYWLCQSLWLCGSQQTVENSERGGNTRPPDLPLEKSVCRQEETLRTGHGATHWFQIGKEVHQGCILSPWLFNLYAEYIMRNAGLDEAQLESRLPGEISITSDMQMSPPLWQKVKRN